MMIGEKYPGCRYWGYEPASSNGLHGGRLSYEEMHKKRETFKLERQAIKAAGMAPQRMGFSRKSDAVKAAQNIEDHTGIEMQVYSHDYL